MTLKNIKQLEREIEEFRKYDYNYFRSHGVDESLVQKCIDNIQKPVKELKVKLNQTREIIKIIEERIDICNKSLEATKDEKWIHIAVVLEGLVKELKEGGRVH